MGTSRLPKPESARRGTPAATESVAGSDGPENRLGGRRFLVTGAGGFIGGHLCARLVLEGASVRGFVRYNSRSSHGTLDWLDASIAGEVDVVRGDLRDYESVAQAMVGSDVVIHLGAQIAIPYSRSLTTPLPARVAAPAATDAVGRTVQLGTGTEVSVARDGRQSGVSMWPNCDALQRCRASSGHRHRPHASGGSLLPCWAVCYPNRACERNHRSVFCQTGDRRGQGRSPKTSR